MIEGSRSAKALATAALMVAAPLAPALAQSTGPPTAPGFSPTAGLTPAASNEGALFLLLPVGAQAVGMSRAVTAMPSPDGAFWNPASLAGLDEGRILIHRGDHVVGEATALSVVFAPEEIGSIAFSYQLLDVGDQDFTDLQGNVLGSISIRSHQGVISFARRLLPRIDAGVNFKLVQFDLACRGQCPDAGVDATTYAVDLGLQSMPFERVPLRLGAMVAHLGRDLRVVDVERADPLPTRIRVAAAYEVLHHFLGQDELGFWITAEVEDRMHSPEERSLYFGTEFTAGSQDRVVVRGGYVHGLGEGTDRPDGAAVGVGLRYERFDVGIARSLASSSLAGASEPVHVSLGIIF